MNGTVYSMYTHYVSTVIDVGIVCVWCMAAVLPQAVSALPASPLTNNPQATSDG